MNTIGQTQAEAALRYWRRNAFGLRERDGQRGIAIAALEGLLMRLMRSRGTVSVNTLTSSERQALSVLYPGVTTPTAIAAVKLAKDIHASERITARRTSRGESLARQAR